jgi:phosphohistidine phosphatase SixA
VQQGRGVRGFALFSITVSVILLSAPVRAQQLQSEDLVKALRRGGYVIVMRHASSPREKPPEQTADPENNKLERQLDDAGRAAATAFGQALRDLKIPVGEVLSSPTYRALETAHYAKLPDPRPIRQLGDSVQAMQDATPIVQAAAQSQTAWLREQVARFPKAANTIVITHLPNIAAAFPEESVGLADGEALVFGPAQKGGAKGHPTLVARLKIDAWPKLAAWMKAHSS